MNPEPLPLDSHIEVELALLPSEHGGRKTPTISGYRPQFYYNNNDCDATHTYLNVAEVKPGDTVTAHLRFHNPQAHVGRMFVGLPFLIREGNRTVGYGRVTRLLGR